MRIVLAGGGTGGHVYPALSVAEALRRSAPAVELLYLGTPAGAERRLVSEHAIPFQAVPAGQVRGKSPLRITASLFHLCQGILASKRILNCFRPAAVFATGGYASVPVVAAAWLARIPLTVFLPDVYPGWAVRLAVRLATRVTTSVDGAVEHLPRNKTEVTGYPLRPEFGSITRSDGRRRLGLEEGPVLLVSGASSGSRSLNDAVLGALAELLECCQIVHLTGAADEQRMRTAREDLPDSLRPRYHIYGYLAEIAWAMAAADLGVLRAGASCLAEPPAAGLPTILVPGPFSDQRRNAEFMAREGAAVLIDQAELPKLPSLVRALFASPERLGGMAKATRRLARPDAAERLAGLLVASAKLGRTTGAGAW